jgi:hypothetical protein
MIFSAEQLFSDDQAVTATAISENVIDLGVAGTPYAGVAPLVQDIGKGAPVCILIQVTEAFVTNTDLTITVEVGATAALGEVRVTETILVADLIVGATTFMQYLPIGIDERYLGVRYTIGGSDATAGAITAGVTMGNQTNYGSA